MLATADNIAFGHWRLDIQRRLLLSHGQPIPLKSRTFDILLFLVENRGSILSREAIVAHVWRDLIVGDNNLTVQMSSLRKTLSEHGGDGLIVTVPGRGYRFVAELEPPELDAEATPSAEMVAQAPSAGAPGRFALRGRLLQRHYVVAGLGLLVIVGVLAGLAWRPQSSAPRLSIAVLPFRNLSVDRSQDYLADALTDDLTTDLAHIPRAIVVARESADVWRGSAVAVQKIGEALNVRYVLEGSLRAEDGQFHVNVQLIDAASGSHLWADRFHKPQGRMSDVRDTIVTQIAGALDFQLVRVESARSSHDRPDNPDALDLFFHARAILDQNDTLADLTRAQRYLERAVQQQPDFADALAELGAMLVVKVRERDDPDDAADYAEAHQAIEKALLISPQNARALAAQARMLAIDGDWSAAKFRAEQALAIEPSSVEAETVLAICAQAQGRFDDAATHLYAVLRLLPASPANRSRYLTLGYVLLMQNRVGDALENLHRAIAGQDDADGSESMGRMEVTHLLLIAATDMQGDIAKARLAYTDYNRRWPHRTVWRFGELISRPNAKLPGYARIMSTLHEAGMPLYAAEDEAYGVAQNGCSGDSFAATPDTLPGGRVVSTSTVQRELVSSPSPLVIDIGRGEASPNAAIWFDPGSTGVKPSDFASQTVRTQVVSTSRPIIVMSDGAFGCDSYDAARRLISEGLRNVQWYRGGEESWAASSLPSVDRRPN